MPPETLPALAAALKIKDPVAKGLKRQIVEF